jgi:hypothetical protein
LAAVLTHFIKAFLADFLQFLVKFNLNFNQNSRKSIIIRIAKQRPQKDDI